MKAFARYAIQKIKQIKLQHQEMVYRAYMADTLRLIGENVAAVGQMCGSEGRYITARYYDIIRPKPTDTRTAEEIIEHVTSRLKGGVRE